MLLDVAWLPYFQSPIIANFVRTAGIVWALYYPIDGDLGDHRLPSDWIALLKTIDLPIAMSQYGAQVSQANGAVQHREAIVAADPLHAGRLFAAAMRSPRSLLGYRSEDGGKSWQPCFEDQLDPKQDWSKPLAPRGPIREVLQNLGRSHYGVGHGGPDQNRDDYCPAWKWDHRAAQVEASDLYAQGKGSLPLHFGENGTVLTYWPAKRFFELAWGEAFAVNGGLAELSRPLAPSSFLRRPQTRASARADSSSAASRAASRSSAVEAGSRKARLATAVAMVALRRSRRELLPLAALVVMVVLPAVPGPERATEEAVSVQPNIEERDDWTLPQARALLTFLQGPKARAVFVQRGFKVE